MRMKIYQNKVRLEKWNICKKTWAQLIPFVQSMENHYAGTAVLA